MFENNIEKEKKIRLFKKQKWILVQISHSSKSNWSLFPPFRVRVAFSDDDFFPNFWGGNIHFKKTLSLTTALMLT